MPRARGGARGVPGARPVGLRDRGPVPAGRPARRGRGRRRALVAAPGELAPVLVVGAPLRWRTGIYNCALAIHARPPARRGAQELPAELPGILREAPVRPGRRRHRRDDPVARPGGAVRDRPPVRGHRPRRASSFAREICEDLWVPDAAVDCGRRWRARRVLANLRPSNITVGKADDRALLCAGRSRCAASAAYVYSAAGPGRIHHRPGLGRAGHHPRARRALAESERFPRGPSQMAVADIDLERLRQERLRRPAPSTTTAAHAATGADLPARRASGPSRRPRMSACCAASSASPSCRPTRRASRRTATRPTTSRSQGLAQAARGDQHRAASSSASRAASIRPTP